MAKIYAELVKKGMKKLADVPLRIRDEVEAVLKEWEGDK